MNSIGPCSIKGSKLNVGNISRQRHLATKNSHLTDEIVAHTYKMGVGILKIWKPLGKECEKKTSEQL